MKVRRTGKVTNSFTSPNGSKFCLLPLPAEFKGMRYALEISHPEKRISYKIDYLFMIFDNEMDLERWYFGLLTVCTPRNGHVDWVCQILQVEPVFHSPLC
jgi:hypothetical protein